MRRLLDIPAFRRLWLGMTASVLGDGIVIVAIGLFVIDFTGSATDTGVVLFAYAAPLVVFLLLGGVIADRVPRQRVLVLSDAVRAACHGLLALLILLDAVEIWHMVLIGAVFGAAEAFFRPAFTGLLPQTVPEDMIQEAYGIVGATREAALFVAPALATALVVGIGAAGAFALDAAFYVASAILVRRVAGRPRGQQEEPSGIVEELREGFGAVRERGWVWATIVVFSVTIFFALAPFFVLGATIAEEQYGSATVYGVINVIWGVGTCTGALAGMRWRPQRPMWCAMWAALPWPASLLVYALGAPLGVVVATTAIGGLGIGLFGVWWETALAQRIPPHLLSRVSAYDWMGSLAFLPLGYLIAGPLAEEIGAATYLALGSAVGVVGIAFGLAPRSTRRLERLERAPA